VTCPPLHAAPAQAKTYTTTVGERSIVTLPDGSRLALNTNSSAEVTYTASERGVRLVRGQALFKVAHNRRQPFRVYAAERVVTATGTRFDVRLEPGLVQVALAEGGVSVESRHRVLPGLPALWGEKEMLVPGKVLRARAETVRINQEDIARLTSWRSGVAVFEDTPLSEAVAEMNRYSTATITFADKAAGQHHLSGTFRTGNPERFARTMAELFPLTVTPSDDGRISLSSKASK
jgi:transmembrane sensor